MPAALLETKFYVPRARRALVPRPRLSERLDRGTALKLVLVSAPAGFGKTTLLTEWLAAGPAGPGTERLAAWLSLDRADNDPASFWTYVITALRTVAPGVGDGALALLQAPQPPPIETVLTAALNDLSAIAADIVLVLDDYHVIDAREVQDAMVSLRQDLGGAAGANAAALVATAASHVAVYKWTFLLGQSLMPGINALLLGSLMYRSRLVLRVIPVTGLIGAPLLIAAVFATLFGSIAQGSPWTALAALPVAAWELSLGIWLVVKGFKSSPVTERGIAG